MSNQDIDRGAAVSDLQQRGTAETEALKEEIEELRRKNRGIEARLGAQKRRQEAIIELLIGPDREIAENGIDHARNFFDRIADAEDQLSDVEKSAKAAIAETTARGDGGEPTKKEIAQKEARNELVRQAAKETGTQFQISISDVQRQARPQTELAYQTVKDAFFHLQTKWAAFGVGENADGQRVVKVNALDISRELMLTVEECLGRDDLSKKLISLKEKEGYSA